MLVYQPNNRSTSRQVLCKYSVCQAVVNVPSTDGIGRSLQMRHDCQPQRIGDLIPEYAVRDIIVARRTAPDSMRVNALAEIILEIIVACPSWHRIHIIGLSQQVGWIFSTG